MNCFRVLSVALLGLAGLPGCGDSDEDPPAPVPTPTQTVLNLDDVSENPDSYTWFEFRPNVMKLILAGAAETEHIAILWYTVEDGAVGLHYHAKTESVYVIDGTQTDAKGTYETGTVYFNPPGSGHQVSDSSGFFLLAYSAPPDFSEEAVATIEEYEPVTIDTEDDELKEAYDFEDAQTDVATFSVPTQEGGGLNAAIIETSSAEDFTYTGNYVLVLEGSCVIDGVPYEENMLIVEKELVPVPFVVTAASESTCLALGVSF